MGLDGSLELVSWNVAGRVRRLDEQIEQIAGLQADAVCLQELTASTLPVWRERLLDTGYATVEHPHVSTAGERTRPLFVLSAWREVARVPGCVSRPPRLWQARDKLGLAALGGRLPARPPARVWLGDRGMPLRAQLARTGALRSLPADRTTQERWSGHINPSPALHPAARTGSRARS